MVVAHIVLARPHQLHRLGDVLSDERGFERVVVIETPSETAARFDEVHVDGAFGDVEQRGDFGASLAWRLAGCPEFKLAVLVVREAVGRLKLSVRDEREGCSCIETFAAD